jgi:hypothetical protein
MRSFFYLVLCFCSITISTFGQVGINTDNSTPDPAAMLDVKSTDKGFLPPRLTTEQMNNVVAPPNGLLVYNTSVNALYWFDGFTWKRFNEFNYTESDPVFIVHPSSSITSENINDWNIAYANRISGVSATAPLFMEISNNHLTAFITEANTSTNGFLTSADWNIFNNKQNVLNFGNVTSPDIVITGGDSAVVGDGMSLTITKGNLTETGSSVLTINNGSNSVLGMGLSIEVKQGKCKPARVFKQSGLDRFQQ